MNEWPHPQWLSNHKLLFSTHLSLRELPKNSDPANVREMPGQTWSRRGLRGHLITLSSQGWEIGAHKEDFLGSPGRGRTGTQISWHLGLKKNFPHGSPPAICTQALICRSERKERLECHGGGPSPGAFLQQALDRHSPPEVA